MAWQYDRYANRSSQSAGTPPGTLTTGVSQLTFDQTKNQISTAGFSYDPAGNLIKDPVPHNYSYNAEGELANVENRGQTGRFLILWFVHGSLGSCCCC